VPQDQQYSGSQALEPLRSEVTAAAVTSSVRRCRASGCLEQPLPGDELCSDCSDFTGALAVARYMLQKLEPKWATA